CYFNKFNKSINEIGILLDKLEEEEEREKENIVNDLTDKLIYIDNELNKSILCKSCKGKKINKLIDILNRLTNKNYLIAETTRLSNELFETLEIIENCMNCNDGIGYYYFNEFNKSMNEVEILLDKLEEGQEREKIHIINNLNDKLIY